MKKIDSWVKKLKILSSFPAVSGNESDLAGWLMSYLDPIADKVFVDCVGNVVAIKGKPKTTIVCHMDKVGYMVSQLTDTGALVVPLKKSKAIPPEKAVWPVTIIGYSNIQGVLMNGDNGLCVIVDACDKSCICVGDLVTLLPNLSTMGNNQVISQGLDNTTGLLTAMTVFEKLSDVCLVATVQEEIDQLGAKFVAKTIDTKWMIVLDVTYDENPSINYPIKIGKGPVICLKDDVIPSQILKNKIIMAAQENKIPHQLEVLESGGSDARAILNVDGAKSLIFIGIPVMFMHSPHEIVNLLDLVSTVKLLVKFCNNYA